MEQQIKVRALIFDDDRLLLVSHRNINTGASWWSPPGGTLQGRESIFDCAIREVWEETGLTITPEAIAYLREYVEPGIAQHNLELYITVSSHSGTLGQVLGEEDVNVIENLRYFSQSMLQALDLYPRELRDTLWADRRVGFARTRYLGIFTRE